MYSFLGNRDTNGDYNEVYYNCDIVNGRTIDQGSSTDPEVKFNETRDSPIIKDASNYDFSIVRFTMNGAGKDLPMFLPVIEAGSAAAPQADRDLTIYQITLRVVYNGVPYTATEPISYVPEDLGAEQPLPPSLYNNTQDLTGRYYFVSTYQHVVDMVNTTFRAVWANLNAQIPASPLEAHVPIMSYNKDNGRFSITLDTYGWGGAPWSAGATSERWSMFFNSNMYGLFSNFKMNYLGGDVAQAGLSYEILTDWLFGAQTSQNTANTTKGLVALPWLDNAATYFSTMPPVPASHLEYGAGAGTGEPRIFYTIEQDYPSTSTLWSPIESIVFTTTLIPVVNEFVGAPARFGDSNDASSSTTQNAFQPLITDIALPMDSAAGYRQFLEYAPNAEYRMISLSSSHQEIKNIDIQVYWKNRLDGNLVPVRMYNLSSISVKMLFRKKNK